VAHLPVKRAVSHGIAPDQGRMVGMGLRRHAQVVYDRLKGRLGHLETPWGFSVAGSFRR
jgi:hypothetical protein